MAALPLAPLLTVQPRRMVGVSRPPLNDPLAELNRKGLITVGFRRLTFHTSEALRSRSASRPPSLVHRTSPQTPQQAATASTRGTDRPAPTGSTRSSGLPPDGTRSPSTRRPRTAVPPHAPWT
jgi:hypothetical protein